MIEMDFLWGYSDERGVTWKSRNQGEIVGYHQGPVSYTHLDVYKRQPIQYKVNSTKLSYNLQVTIMLNTVEQCSSKTNYVVEV